MPVKHSCKMILSPNYQPATPDGRVAWLVEQHKATYSFSFGWFWFWRDSALCVWKTLRVVDPKAWLRIVHQSVHSLMRTSEANLENLKIRSVDDSTESFCLRLRVPMCRARGGGETLLQMMWQRRSTCGLPPPRERIKALAGAHGSLVGRIIYGKWGRYGKTGKIKRSF